MSFRAEYGGQCYICEERIHVGDVTTYYGVEVGHFDCEESSQPERKAEVCTQCWLTKPCECEE